MSLGIDAIGLIPEAGGIARIIGHGAGYRGIVADRAGYKIIDRIEKTGGGILGLNGLDDTATEGIVSTGLAISGFVPGWGTAVSAISLGWDLFKTAKAIGKCD